MGRKRGKVNMKVQVKWKGAWDRGDSGNVQKMVQEEGEGVRKGRETGRERDWMKSSKGGSRGDGIWWVDKKGWGGGWGGYKDITMGKIQEKRDRRVGTGKNGAWQTQIYPWLFPVGNPGGRAHLVHGFSHITMGMVYYMVLVI